MGIRVDVILIVHLIIVFSKATTVTLTLFKGKQCQMYYVIYYVPVTVIYILYTVYIYTVLLHNVHDIECKYGFRECKYRTILHGSTTDCTAASACGQMIVKRGRKNGGKLILSMFYFVV